MQVPIVCFLQKRQIRLQQRNAAKSPDKNEHKKKSSFEVSEEIEEKSNFVCKIGLGILFLFFVAVYFLF